MFRIRRGKRTDLAALEALCRPGASAPRSGKDVARHWRRLADDPGLDFYVAQDDDGLHGVVLLSYVRRLRDRGWHAFVDIALEDAAPTSVGNALIEFAKRRARTRACDAVLWLPDLEVRTPPEVAALLADNGFCRRGACWVCPIEAGSSGAEA